MAIRRHLLASSLALPFAGLARAGLAQGDAWPTRPVRIVVAWAPGGAVDTIARRLAPRLSEALDVVERAEFNDRYRKLISDSRELLAQEQVRLTQARGIAKKLMVLSRRAGADFHAGLDL